MRFIKDLDLDVTVNQHDFSEVKSLKQQSYEEKWGKHKQKKNLLNLQTLISTSNMPHFLKELLHHVNYLHSSNNINHFLPVLFQPLSHLSFHFSPNHMHNFHSIIIIQLIFHHHILFHPLKCHITHGGTKSGQRRDCQFLQDVWGECSSLRRIVLSLTIMLLVLKRYYNYLKEWHERAAAEDWPPNSHSTYTTPY